MNNEARNKRAIARILASFSRYRLGLTLFVCKANRERSSFEYHIYAQRRGSGTRGGRGRNVRYWVLENLYPEQREVIAGLRKHEEFKITY